MHVTTHNNHPTRNDGFTLVEVLIIAPIALLIISGFIALMVTLTGDVLSSSARTNLIEKTDSALDRFEQDTRFAKEFRETSFTPTHPQGRNHTSGSATQPFNVVSPLPDDNNYGTVRILRSYVTTKNPLDSSKSLIYTTARDGVAGAGAADCGTPAMNQNDPYEHDIIYYVKRSSGSEAENNLRYSMWRRIILQPGQTLCGSQPAIWQKSTCPAGVTGTPCQAEDEKLIDNLVPGGFGGYYANQPDQSTTLGRPDCIRQCPHGLDIGNNVAPLLAHSHIAGDELNILYPTSTDGVNARASYFFLGTKLTVAGRDAEYSAGVYARRMN